MSKGKDQYNVSVVQEADNISCSIRSMMLPCRDGVRLHTVIYFPVNMPAKAPVILRRSPYCQKHIIEPPDGWALKNGVVSIMQSCRGTAWSEGVFDPAERDSEKNDVEDLFLWLRKQDWFNGRCVMAQPVVAETMTLNLTNCPAGIYLLRRVSNEGKRVGAARIVKR